MRKNFSCLHKLEQQQGGVGEHPQWHPGILFALKFQKQHEIEPILLLPADAPDDIVVPLAQIVCHVVAGAKLQGRKIQFTDKSLRNKVPEKRFHHQGITEKSLVCGVMRRMMRCIFCCFQFVFLAKLQIADKTSAKPRNLL